MIPELADAAYPRVLRPVLFGLGGGDPEVAHERMMGALRRLPEIPGALAVARAAHVPPNRRRRVAGLSFPGPVGLAAGLDKYAMAVRAWGALGFSHVELGTVTARPQPGNPRPRLFRLRDSRAIINRMGFNNPGADAMAASLTRQGIVRGTGAAGIPVGVSLGKSKLTPVEDAVGDYVHSFDRLAGHADYVAINVSSPNTPGLRGLQDRAALDELVSALIERSRGLSGGPIPLLVKMAPDLDWSGIDDVLTVCADRGVAGIIATNTTIGRDGIAPTDEPLATEAGGLSGAPVRDRAREVVAYCTQHADLPVIGVGGIMCVDDAQALFDAGAVLVQIYTGYIYEGMGLVNAINRRIRD